MRTRGHRRSAAGIEEESLELVSVAWTEGCRACLGSPPLGQSASSPLLRPSFNTEIDRKMVIYSRHPESE